MIYCGDDLAKIKIIDQAFNVVSLDDVRHIFGADVIIDKLKGMHDREGPLMQAARELQNAASELAMVRTECIMLKADIQTLIRCLNKGMGDSMVTGDFNSLKQRHGIY